MNNNTIRAFISIDLPREIIREIEKTQNTLKQKNLFTGKFTEPKNLHLTLKFLGEISENKLNQVKTKLENFKFKKIQINLGELGVFSEKFIRIIWIHLVGQGILNLQKQIDLSLEDLFPKEKRFMSHLTIARVKKVQDKAKLLEKLKKIRLNQKFEIDKIYLKKSDLTLEGPIYTNLLEIDLEKKKQYPVMKLKHT